MTIARESVTLAERLVALQYEWEPSLAARYGEAGRAKCEQDAVYHLNYLAEALQAGSPLLFTDYVRWATALLVSRNIPPSDLVKNLRCMHAVLTQDLPDEMGAAAAGYIHAALNGMGVPVEDETQRERTLRALADAYLGALRDGQADVARRLIEEAVGQGTPVRDLYLDVFQWTQHEIGRLWQTNEMSVAEEHLGTAITRDIMAQLAAQVEPASSQGKTFVMACVAQERHEMGARMVTDFFRLEGWTTYYLGADVPEREVVKMVKQHDADVLGISATMIAHLSHVTRLIRLLRRDPVCAAVKVLVGGYPFNVDPSVWQQLGADGCASSADAAVRLAEALTA